MKTKAHQRLKARLLRSLVLGFAAAATVVPAAQARMEIEGGATVDSAGYVAFATDFPKASSSTQSAAIPYLSHGVGLTENPATALVRSDGPDGVRPATQVLPVSVNAVDDGFEWQPYGIGAASGIALALLAAASLAGMRRRDRMALS